MEILDLVFLLLLFILIFSIPMQSFPIEYLLFTKMFFDAVEETTLNNFECAASYNFFFSINNRSCGECTTPGKMFLVCITRFLNGKEVVICGGPC